MPQKDPCQKQACEIQKCLQGNLTQAKLWIVRPVLPVHVAGVAIVMLLFIAANKYIESRCADVIQAMRKCCAAHAGEESVCCSGFAKEHGAGAAEQKK